MTKPAELKKELMEVEEQIATEEFFSRQCPEAVPDDFFNKLYARRDELQQRIASESIVIGNELFASLAVTPTDEKPEDWNWDFLKGVSFDGYKPWQFDA